MWFAGLCGLTMLFGFIELVNVGQPIPGVDRQRMSQLRATRVRRAAVCWMIGCMGLLLSVIRAILN